MTAGAGTRAVRRALVLALAATMAGLLGRAVLALPREPAGLTELVETRLAETGVEHGVTAVLLNFRGYDTWLELAVLFLALVGSLGVRPRRGEAGAARLPPAGALLSALGRVLFPLMVLVAGYFLWLGKFAPGGAFQAGVVLAAALLLWWLSGARGLRKGFARWWGRALAVLGLLAFLVAAIASLSMRGVLLEYPADAAAAIILAIELLAAVSIGVTLGALLIAPRSMPPEPSSPSTVR